MNNVWKKKQKAHEEDYFKRREKESLDKLRNKVDKEVVPSEHENPAAPLKEKKGEDTAGWNDDLI